MMSTTAHTSADRDRPLRAWLELLRLPNLATAWADILMGFLVTHASFQPLPVLLLLVGASSGFYLAGMVFNDLFDLEVDRRERPGRPIPSGRITPIAARRGAILLLATGLALSWLAALLVGDWRPAIVGTLLAVAVLLYDGPLKQTAIAPLLMGSCRFLNVLLGMSAAAFAWQPMLWLIAAGIGVYIAGVTWYARTEARASNRWRLLLGIAVMALGIGLLAWFPAWRDPADPPIYTTPDRWRLMMVLLGALIGWRAFWGVIEPIPARVQMAVKQAILSLIVLDASVCFVFRELEGALPILLLIVPAMWLGKWIYST